MVTQHSKLTLQSGIGTLLIIGIIGAVLVIGGIGYAAMKSSRMAPSESATAPAESAAAPTGTTARLDDGTERTATFEQLLSAGQNLECDWKMPQGAQENLMGSGKLYATSNMGRSMYTGTVNGVTMEGNAIYKDGGVTGWMMVNGQKFGFRMSEEEIASSNAALTEDQKKQAEQIRSEMIVSCKPWTPDMSFFEVPSDITFN